MIKKESAVKPYKPISISEITSILPGGFSQMEIAYFDIETTGLSSASSYLYLIGCMFFAENEIRIIQWFSENINEEKLILEEFQNFIASYRILVHFNGSTFDVPYIADKCRQYGVKDNSSDLFSCDLYRILKPYKKLFSLSSMRQKSLEKFLSVDRKDRFDGSELIDIYLKYTALRHYEILRKNTPDCEYRTDRFSGLPHFDTSDSYTLLSAMLLHNYEDVTNMLYITLFSSVDSLFGGGFSLADVPIQTAMSGSVRYLKIGITAPFFDLLSERAAFMLTAEPFKGLPPVLLKLEADIPTLFIPVFSGELKMFYSDYENYYYLPEEDRAMHKSIAGFVDKGYKEKARLTNCYDRFQGCFLPQPSECFQPSFKSEYKSRYTFFRADMISEASSEDIIKYVMALLTAMK